MVLATPSRYGSLGVDVEKRGIERLKALTDDLYPQSFCSVTRHPARTGSGILLHVDGAGTKPIVSYLMFKESGDQEWFSCLASDVIAMNVDDIACVGGTPLAISDYVALNPFTIKKEALLGGIADGFQRTLLAMDSMGYPLLFCGGETADLPDIVRTFDISATVYGEVDLKHVITGDKICPGDVIVGLRSGGKAKYEPMENSGLMCNGITLARHSLLSPSYSKKYPEIGSGERAGYFGHHKLASKPKGLGMTIGEALLSPTRIFMPVIGRMMKKVVIKAFVHNTGGGLTKCKRLGRGICYVKDALLEPDPIFKLIQEGSQEGWGEMCRVFNMGIGMEAIVTKANAAEVIGISESFGIGAQVIGRCERSPSGRNSVVIVSEKGTFQY